MSYEMQMSHYQHKMKLIQVQKSFMCVTEIKLENFEEHFHILQQQKLIHKDSKFV